MKWLIATLIVLTTISGSSFAASSPSEAAPSIEVHPQSSPNLSTATPGEDTAAETALLESVNRSRKQAGVAPVHMDESLRQAARLHARRMVTARQLEHQFPGEPSLLQRIADVSSLPLDRAGENIADVSCPDDAHDLLMHSPPHRENILDPHFNVAGIVAIWSHGRLYVVQDFGHAMPSYSARETARRVGEALNEVRVSAGLSALAPFSPPHLDEAACSLAKEDRPNARIVAASYTNRKVITYTQSTPDALPPAASDVLENPNLRHFAVGSCYARNAAYPTGIYWVAILLY
ncbi:MAG: CAP domain-containing protein [Terriglobales bacterium]